MSVRIIVDSSADVAERFQKRLCVVPLTIHFGSEELIDGVTIDKAHFYQRLVESDQLPTTSQATPAAFQKVYEQTVQAGDSAVVITLSGKLSGTYQSACIAAEEFDHVYVVDSQTAAIGTGILAEYALSCVDAGMPADVIAAQLEQKREDVCLVALLDTLEYLNRGVGRRPAEYQAGRYSPGRRGGSDRQGPRIQTGKQPAGREDSYLRRDRLQPAYPAGLQRPQRRISEKICGGQQVTVAGWRGKAGRNVDQRRDRYPHRPRRGSRSVFQKALRVRRPRQKKNRDGASCPGFCRRWGKRFSPCIFKGKLL